THSAVVVLHKVVRTDGARQLARLRMLAHALDQLGPSEACDGIVVLGDGRGLCNGQVDGPVGKVSVRVPITATMTEGANGSLSVVFANPAPMEAKGVFGWSDVVAANRLKVAYDMF